VPNSFWSELFAWLDRNLAKILLSFGIGYRVGSNGKEQLKKDLEVESYEKEKLQNEIDVSRDATHRDIIADFIKSNRDRK